MQVRFALLVSVSLFPLSTAAFAQETTLPRIVITPTRSEQPINQIASSMTVITASDIAQRNQSTVSDVLRTVPGLTLANNGGAGQTTRLFMRGSNSNHVLVLIDGVRVNDPSDPGEAFDFANLSTDNIEQIEVLRGPQSTLYGSQAIGGVINIITKKGRGAPKQTAFVEYGRYNSLREGVGSAGEVGKTSYSFTATHGRTDGISSIDKRIGGKEKDGNDTYTVSANAASKLSEIFTAKLNSRYTRVYTQFDSPGSFTRPLDDAQGDNDSRQFNGRVAGELSLYGGKWKQELGVSTLNLRRAQTTVYYDSLFNELFGRQEQNGWRQQVDWVHRLNFVPHHEVSLGGEMYSDHFKSSNVAEVNVDTRAFFVQDQITYDGFFASVGARNDHQQAFGDQFTWKVAPGYHIPDTGTTIKASYGTGFKAPSLSQLYDTSYGNVRLQPETSRGWEAGIEQSLMHDDLVFGATAFRSLISNLISNNPAPPYASINLGKALTEGVESNISLRATKDLQLTLNHTLTRSENKDKNKDLLRRPRNMLNAGVMYQYSPEWDMSANMRYTSSRKDVDINSPYGLVYVKPFATVDLSANYKVNSHFTLYSRIENLLDKRYQEVFAYGQPGMSLYAGVKVQY